MTLLKMRIQVPCDAHLDIPYTMPCPPDHTIYQALTVLIQLARQNHQFSIFYFYPMVLNHTVSDANDPIGLTRRYK